MAEKKVKFTVIDAVIILAVIAVIAVGAIKLAPGMFTVSDKEKAEFTILIASKNEGLANAMSVGDKVTLSLAEKDGGIIKNIETKPAEILTFNGIEGSYSKQVVEGQVDIYVTVEADVDVSDLYVKTGDTPVRVGAEIPVRGKGFASMGYVVTLNEEGGTQS